MIEWTLKKIIGTKNERELKRAWPRVARINALESRMRELADADFPRETARLKQEIANGRPLDDVLFEAFALAREGARRTIGQRHFDVQLIGGMFLHQGCIAEMRTGEGKTLTATLPSYLNALTGRGVHVVTVNDYLARRDAEWMGRLHNFLGLTVGCIVHDLDDAERQTAYRSDITYGQNNEFGFDYLRDNMKFRLSGLRPARAELRHRRRGGQHPHRRGADAAHHLRPHRGEHRRVLPDRPGHPGAGPGSGLRARREDPERQPHRRRGGEGPEAARHLQPLRPERDRDAAPRGAGPALAHPLQARPRLRGEGRRGDHRRRVHRPPHARPPLERRAAPGGGGQGGGQDRERDPDPGHHLVPELLPHVLQALGHDRHRRHRGRGVREDLQPRRPRRPHQPPDGPQGRRGRGLQDRAREVRGGGAGDQGAPREGPAGPGGHGLHRQERGGLHLPEEEGRPPPRAERQAAPARGGDRRPGRPQGRGHHLHQHGRPRHGHPPRRQPRGPGPGRGRCSARASALRRRRPGGPGGPPGGGRGLGEAAGEGGGEVPGRDRAREGRGARRRGPVHPRHRAARVTPHRQPAARPRWPPG